MQCKVLSIIVSSIPRLIDTIFQKMVCMRNYLASLDVIGMFIRIPLQRLRPKVPIHHVPPPPTFPTALLFTHLWTLGTWTTIYVTQPCPGYLQIVLIFARHAEYMQMHHPWSLNTHWGEVVAQYCSLQ